MKCGERIPPESITTTRGASPVNAFVRSHYNGLDAEERHMFAYDVEFSNGGSSAVQLLSRHWVFVDENGKSEEVPIIAQAHPARFTVPHRAPPCPAVPHRAPVRCLRLAGCFTLRISLQALPCDAPDPCPTQMPCR